MENLSEAERALLFITEYGERAANLYNKCDVSRKLFTDFHRALHDAEQYAIDTVERAAQQCVKTIDLYLECKIYNFEVVHSSLQKSMYLQLCQFQQNANELYWKQLMVLDRYLMDCATDEDIKEIRKIFTLSCNLPMCSKVAHMKKRFYATVESAIDYRKDEIRNMLIDFKLIDKEVSLGGVEDQTESELPFDEYFIKDVQVCVWKNRKLTNFEANVEVCKKIKTILDNEISRSTILWDVITQVSIEYCKGAIDCSLDADVTVFDEFIQRCSSILDTALRTSDKVIRAIIDRLSINSKSDYQVSQYTVEYYNNEIQHLLRENAAYFRGEMLPLHNYRINERKDAIERYRARLKASDELLINNSFLHDEYGNIAAIRDLDLSNYTLTPIGAGGQGFVYSFELSEKKVVAKKFYSEKDEIEIKMFCHVSNHPSILRMICRGHKDAERYLILEYCPSSIADELITLRQSKVISALDKEEFIDWIRQLAGGMQYLHRHTTEACPELYKAVDSRSIGSLN